MGASPLNKANSASKLFSSGVAFSRLRDPLGLAFGSAIEAQAERASKPNPSCLIRLWVGTLLALQEGACSGLSPLCALAEGCGCGLDAFGYLFLKGTWRLHKELTSNHMAGCAGGFAWGAFS